MTKALIEFASYAILYVCEFVSALAEETASSVYDYTSIAFNYLDQLDPQTDLFLFMVISTLLTLAVSKLLVEVLLFTSKITYQIFEGVAVAIATATRKGVRAYLTMLIKAGESTCKLLKVMREKI